MIEEELYSARDQFLGGGGEIEPDCQFPEELNFMLYVLDDALRATARRLGSDLDRVLPDIGAFKKYFHKSNQAGKLARQIYQG
jgi:hypothetical protein